MRRLLLAACLVAAACLPAAPAAAQFTVITEPVRVPLHWRHTNGADSGPRKLGVYVTLGGGATPQLFEFDTGGDGFYATFASGTASPWWGTGWTATSGTFSQTYDSGMTYTGAAVTTTVSLYADASGGAPLLTATSAIVGQTDSIVLTKDNVTDQLWPIPGGTGPPPVEQAFYGDFGMAPKQGQAGIDSLAAQLLYAPGVTAGFRVHAASETPWVQFGLSAADTALLPTTFALNVASGSSPAGIAYYDNLVVTGSLSVTHEARAFEQPTGFIFDTGASTTIHSGTNIAFPLDLTDDGEGTEVKHHSLVVVSGSSLLPGGDWQTFMDFSAGPTADVDKVQVQYKDGPYYLNTGIMPFLQYDFVYNLADRQLTIVPVPEPSAGLLAALGGGAWLWHRQRRHRSRSSIP